MTADAGLQQARIVAGFGRNHLADLGDGIPLPCVARGRRTDVVCGDQVLLRFGQPAVIESVLPRRNTLWRQDDWRSKVFAANLDLVLVVVAAEPGPNLDLAGRAIIAAQAEDIPVAIIINKRDLPGAAALRKQLQPLQDAGYELIELAARADPDDARATLRPWLEGRVSMLLGASGVGKSTLVNTLIPGLDVQTQTISTALNAGRHTTTATRLYHAHDLGTGTALLDSPGFQSFGLQQLSTTQLQHAFPEIKRLNGQCRFNNCSHRHEPGCAVRAAVETGGIASSRMALYLRVLQELLAAPPA